MSAEAKDKNQSSLREFISEYGERVFTFCDYMLPKEAKIEQTVIAIFSDFSESYRKRQRKLTQHWEETEMRVKLFSIAWEHIRHAMEDFHFVWTPGRDTRGGKRADDNLLKEGAKSAASTEIAGELIGRLKYLDPEFRAPLILRDIVRLEEEEILRVLGLRWGVYRHRLHRGRVEYKDGLKGPQINLTTKGSQPTF